VFLEQIVSANDDLTMTLTFRNEERWADWGY